MKSIIQKFAEVLDIDTNDIELTDIKEETID